VAGILLFRKEALDKLNAPEDLDTAIRLVTTTHWLAVAALSSLVVATTSWGLFGVTHRTLEGTGVIESGQEGRVARVYVSSAAALQVRQGFAASVRVPGSNAPLRGRVVEVAAAPESASSLANMHANDPSLSAHPMEGQRVAVTIALPDARHDESAMVGYSIRGTVIGPPMRPIGLLFPRLSNAFGL
jgi:hypothetical protein